MPFVTYRPLMLPPRGRLMLWALFVALVCVTSAHAQRATAPVPDYVANLKHIRTLLELPDNRIDLARAELTIDKMIDPAIDIEANLKKIDAMVAKIQRKLPARPSSLDKVKALREYLYIKGEWNQNQPYQYDFSDPMGTRVHNKLLPNYLASKKGNCVSMPLLFIVLGQKLGIDVTVALAPAHVFVKYRDEAGNWLNLETTGTAKPTSEASYRDQSQMTDEAIANGIYMRPLSKKEALTVMLETLMQHYLEQRQYGQVIAVANLVLERYPKSVTAILHRGGAYARLQDKLVSEYAGMATIPPVEREYFKELGLANHAAFAQAEALGWRELTPEQNNRYLQKVQQRIQANP